MFLRILNPKTCNLYFIRRIRLEQQPIEWGLRKWDRPHVYKSLKDRFREFDYTLHSPADYTMVNIGLHKQVKDTSEVRKKRKSPKEPKPSKSEHLQKAARNLQLWVDLDNVEEYWRTESASKHTITLAHHYKIYRDMFGPLSYFHLQFPLDVLYNFDDEFVSPVYRGNTIKPLEASCPPTVLFDSDPDDIWTLALSSPDNNLIQNDMETLHWMVGNIRGGDISSGDVVMDYLPPFPPRGVGYLRYVFILYKQTHLVDFSSMTKPAPCTSLMERNYSSCGFMAANKDAFTPATLSWFQSDWDSSVRTTFHQTLKMKEPVYEYQFPPPYIAPVRPYPVRNSFNKYVDRYRDSQDREKDVLMDRLKTLDPFKPEDPVLEFPMAIPIDTKLVVWEKEDIRSRRLGFGKYRNLFRGTNRPEILPANPLD